MQAPPEQLGSFYLGAEYDLDAAARKDAPINYDARDLVTHAVCVGMTGSGKTGLCIGLLEEAALDKVPAILIDPKGDITNLLLQFPELSPADFQTWINEDDARRKNKTVEEFAAATAENWKNGLADWGISGDRMRLLAKETEYTIFTPGSDMGVPLNILGSLAAPKLDWATEAESLRERISGTVAALLGLAGINADPVRSREGILLANIFEFYWQKGEDLDLAKLITSIQKPPVRQLGVVDVDTFYPEKDRFQLAMAFNTLVASPRFQTWLQGEPLDVDRLFYNADGKPRHSVMYIAHLSDSERMFIVTLLLENVLTWMRKQSGTTSLRALLYFDEVFGYFPPSAEPSSKRPLLTLLKQARAFGLGIVLVTQNPVDIDYKGLTNAGTWFIGKLQAERDKERVLSGLKGALSEAGQATTVDYDKIITRLGSRVFLMHNVNDARPTVFTTRWAMSYLRGPLTLPQVRTLMAPRKSQPNAAPVTSAAPQPATAPAPAAATPVALAVAPAGSGLLTAPPAVEPGITQVYLPLVLDDRDAIQAVSPKTGATVKRALLVYQAGVVGAGTVRFVDAKRQIDAQQEYNMLSRNETSITGVEWAKAERLSVKTRDVLSAPQAMGENQGPFYTTVPEGVGTAKKLTAAGKDLADWLYYNAKYTINVHPDLGIAQRSGEDERAYRIRLQQAARERRDAEVDKLAKQYDKQLKTVADKLAREEAELARDQATAQAKQTQQWVGIGESVANFFMGRRSSRAMSSAASKWDQAQRASASVEESKQAIARLQEEQAKLQAELQQKVDEITAQWDGVSETTGTEEIKPKRTDVAVKTTVLAWTPTWQISFEDATGERTASIDAHHLPDVG